MPDRHYEWSMREVWPLCGASQRRTATANGNPRGGGVACVPVSVKEGWPL